MNHYFLALYRGFSSPAPTYGNPPPGQAFKVGAGRSRLSKVAHHAQQQKMQPPASSLTTGGAATLNRQPMSRDPASGKTTTGGNGSAGGSVDGSTGGTGGSVGVGIGTN